MNDPVFADPDDTGRRQFRMRSEEPMKTIAANGGEQHKEKKIGIDGFMQYDAIGLINHNDGIACNKKITVNEERK